MAVKSGADDQLRRSGARLLRRLLWVPPGADLSVSEHGRFVAALALVSLPALLLIAVIVVPLWLDPENPLRSPTFWSGVLMMAATLTTYAMNRRGHYRAAAQLFTLASIGTLALAASQSPLLLMYLPLTMLGAVWLLPVRQAAAIGVAAIATALPVAYWFRHDDPGRVVLPFLLNAFFLPLALVVKWHQDRLERLRAEELARRERWFFTTLSSIGDAVLTTDAQEAVTFLNPVAENLTGFSSAQALGRKVTEVFRIVSEHEASPLDGPVREVLAQRAIVGLGSHAVLVARDGTRRPITESAAPIVGSDDVLLGVVLVFRDMTEERALRAQVEHSQRLDALGKLAGGVAHDFNNLLTAIGGGAQLALDDLPSEHTAREPLMAALEAAQRAVGVTRQLLAFSRRQVMRLEPIELTPAVRAALRLLHSLLPNRVMLTLDLQAEAGFVLVDPVQLEQVLLNLALNAADAMPAGGTLTLSTSRVSAADAGVEPRLPPGTYGRLRVIDTGIGMDQATLARIFEPFFTTKGQGRGTGLGLATVYGIVEQSKGAIRVHSVPGAGSTFDIYLPATLERAAATGPGEKVEHARVDRTASVLLVEDEEIVRRLLGRVLTQHGYRVLEASSAQHALELIEERAGTIDLLLTDVVMPGRSGVELAALVRVRFPELPVLYMSGYATEVLAREGLRDDADSFIAKPFTPDALCSAVRAALERSGGARTSAVLSASGI